VRGRSPVHRALSKPVQVPLAHPVPGPSPGDCCGDRLAALNYGAVNWQVWHHRASGDWWKPLPTATAGSFPSQMPGQIQANSRPIPNRPRHALIPVPVVPGYSDTSAALLPLLKISPLQHLPPSPAATLQRHLCHPHRRCSPSNAGEPIHSVPASASDHQAAPRPLPATSQNPNRSNRGWPAVQPSHLSRRMTTSAPSLESSIPIDSLL
jgi:hypothetical protein